MRIILLRIFLLLNVQLAFCQWESLNTGLNDDLTGVVFFGNNGLVSGKKGLYYTTIGGQGGSSWKRFEITDNPVNATIYENTSFTHCYSNPAGSATTGFVYACGQNTLTKQAIIIEIELPSLKYSILYIGKEDSKLNKIDYGSSYVAVGDKGLIVRFNPGEVMEVKNISTDNFSSVSFYYDKCKIGSDGKILFFNYFDSSYSFVEMLTPGVDNKAVVYGSGTYNTGRSFSVGNKFLYYNTYNELSYSHTNYFGGPLNARSISASSTSEYVGTDHGIYRNSGNVLEWQSTSLNYAINSFWQQRGTNTVYASGDLGVILKTTNGGGTSIPYVKISDTVLGGCAGNYSQLDAIAGSVSSCKWFVNNVQVNTSCSGSLSYRFSTAGTYEIKYTVKNSFGVESTSIKNISIVSVPVINLPVTVSDNILCKSESIDVKIQNSEKDVVYTLKNEDGTKSYGTSEPGNGQTISFKTTLISQSGNYRLQAKNANANCYANFSDKFYITVEKTQAKFHADLINATPGESATFYQKAVDAQNYKWDFAPNASVATSNGEQEKVSFSKEGDTKINLEVWSNNGCYDQIEQNGPFVYNASQNSNGCWALINDGVDSSWNKYEYEGIDQLTPTEDGFLTCGGFNDQTFDSKIGLKANFKNKIGSYLAKHDRDGALKWIVSTEQSPFSDDRTRDVIYSSVVDHDGNIYLSGVSEGYFIDNKGERVKINNSYSNYIIKLDKQGKIIWKLTTDAGKYSNQKLYIDKENNLITTILLSALSPNKHHIYLNGVESTVIDPAMNYSTAGNLTMLKISPAGVIIWYTGISLGGVNGGGINDIGFDNDNNIYLGGNYKDNAIFYSESNTVTPQVLTDFTGSSSKIFLTKYNKDGIVQWKIRSAAKGAFFNDTYLNSMVTDKNGDSYITGNNGCKDAKAVHFFENSDGTTTQKSIGGFYLAKVNSLGICQWITGSQYANSVNTVGGSVIIKDNDKLHIIGELSGSGTFITGDGQNCNLSMSYYDFFLATYDLSGNLKKITANGDNENHATVPYKEKFNFFKAEDGTFYLSSNMRANNYTSFGSIISTNGVDGTVIHFDEDCGIVKYENTLSTEDFTKNLNAVIYPNPTSGKISVDLESYDGNANVEIYDANGKKMSEEKAVDLSKINLTINGSQGLYFVKIKTDKKTQTFKVLKQ
ncbi:T9SS type A sorting domain-containing protein [Flavobacterium salmonis]|uniref:Secretion system C-terminal sorting domain-containing protein n=1 Tax=Flavobacterium salmonis TaxID=2654844 RepID=A0A6V6YV03_9FLAO|nr:T9SS type A sorting domain-containing protein [Flavobacterium salmonis]CAD0003320.1 hypothetical protein FLAT13_01613 [Flavobacterium salmonis]